MKENALSRIVESAKITLIRFPLTLGFAFATCVLVISLIFDGFDIDLREGKIAPRLLVTFLLGIPLSYTVQVALEGLSQGKTAKLIGYGATLGLLVLYFFTIPAKEDLAGFYFLVFNTCLHLAAAFAPYIKNRSETGFWEYNRILFARFGLATAYAAISYGGLALAIGALKFLFDIRIHAEIFGCLFALFAFVFQPWVFLSGVPSVFETLEEEDEYPRGLKILIQFILIPLVGLYLLILYVYGAQIAISMELPKGGLTYMILSFSIAGMLTVLLAYPLGQKEGNKWVKIFTKGYFWALVPLMVMLYVAISTRVLEYGFTVPRYYVVFLAAWLTGIVAYFIIAKNPRIRAIPISLFTALVITLFGPWGSFFVSKTSQSNRLIKVFESKNAIVDGKLATDIDWDYDSQQQADDILEYLDQWHNNNKISEILPDSVTNWGQIRVHLGWEVEVESTPITYERQVFDYRTQYEFVRDIAGYEAYEIWSGYADTTAYQPNNTLPHTLKTNRGDYVLYLNQSTNVFSIQPPTGERILIPAQEWLLQSIDDFGSWKSGLEIEEMSLKGASETHVAKLIFVEIRGDYFDEDKSDIKLQTWRVEILVGRKSGVPE